MLCSLRGSFFACCEINSSRLCLGFSTDVMDPRKWLEVGTFQLRESIFRARATICERRALGDKEAWDSTVGEGQPVNYFVDDSNAWVPHRKKNSLLLSLKNLEMFTSWAHRSLGFNLCL